MNIKNQYDLVNIIRSDLINLNKISIILFIMVLITAFAVVITTYQSRLFTFQYEKMILEGIFLDTEWRNLILEENLLEDYNRIERIAIQKLRMRHVNSLRKVIYRR